MVGAGTREGRGSPINKTTREAKQKPKERCSNNHLSRWLMFPMKLFSSLWEVWGSVHLSTALLSLSPSPTHIHIHTQSVLLSFYTYILNGILSWLISLGDSLPFSPAYKAIIYWRLIMEQVRHKGFIYLFFYIRILKTFLFNSHTKFFRYYAYLID